MSLSARSIHFTNIHCLLAKIQSKLLWFPAWRHSLHAFTYHSVYIHVFPEHGNHLFISKCFHFSCGVFRWDIITDKCKLYVSGSQALPADLNPCDLSLIVWLSCCVRSGILGNALWEQTPVLFDGQVHKSRSRSVDGTLSVLSNKLDLSLR